MMRRVACVGDELEHGGDILPYSGQPFTIGNGHQVALIGGQAYCAACKSTGTIAKSGGPRRLNFMGETAADGDIVLCKCSTPPRIIALLAGNTWCDDMAGSGNSMGHPHSSSGFSGDDVDIAEAGEIIEQFFELVDGETEAPVAGYLYDLFSNGQQIARKAIFSDGRTIAFNHGSRVSLVMWLDKSGEVRP
ncbi:PAAR domain-containing protein [Cupriavidus sp. PET2-C1]